MPRESLNVEHLKKTYPQINGETPSEYYERLHYHARKLKLVHVRANLDEAREQVTSDNMDSIEIIKAIRDLADLVEDLI